MVFEGRESARVVEGCARALGSRRVVQQAASRNASD